MTEPTGADIDAMLRSKANVHDLMVPPEVVDTEPPPEPTGPRPTALPGGGYAPVHSPPSMEDWIRKEVRVLKYGADPRRSV